MACCFSLLAEPLFYTLIISALYALISKLGFSRSAELIYSSFQSTFGRNEYKKFMASWRELKGAKVEVLKVSPQDEFARWAKLQRKVDKLQVDFDKQYSSRQKGLLGVQFIGSIVLRILCYTSIAIFLYLNTSNSVMSLNLFRKELDSFSFVESLLAFPSAEKGELSVFVWAFMTQVALKEVFNFL